MNETDPQRARGRAERGIGRAGGYAAGPTMVCVAALHGNEPAGVRALKRVLHRIENDRISIRGEFVGYVGNVGAFDRQARFIDEDLNRIWGPVRGKAAGDRTATPSPPPSTESAEVRERAELSAALDPVLQHAQGPVFLLDLHTASSTTAPFVVLGDTLRNREFALRFPIPAVLGLEEHIAGTLMEHVTDQGHVGLAIEGGRHDDEASVDRIESAVWLALAFAGCLTEAQVPNYDLHAERLRRAADGIPSLLEIVHREPAGPAFEMTRQLRNFDRVRRGDVLAREAGRPIRASRSAHVFLPRYQAVGDDGFFLARGVNPLWLIASSYLRRTPLARWVVGLPGVRRESGQGRSGQDDVLVVNTGIARFFARRIFHLLGYRVVRAGEAELVAARRREKPPKNSRDST